jgi:hypothetical protein
LKVPRKRLILAWLCRRRRGRRRRRRALAEATERAMHFCNQARDLIDADSILRDVATDDPQSRSGDRCSTSMSSVSNADISAGCSAGISASLMGLNPRSIASAGSCHLITRSLRRPIRSGVRQWQSRSVLVANRRKPSCRLPKWSQRPHSGVPQTAIASRGVARTRLLEESREYASSSGLYLARLYRIMESISSVASRLVLGVCGVSGLP